jgi:hypothetical protein
MDGLQNTGLAATIMAAENVDFAEILQLDLLQITNVIDV